MAGLASRVGSGDGGHLAGSPSRGKTWGFAIAIIAGIGGLVVGAIGWLIIFMGELLATWLKSMP